MILQLILATLMVVSIVVIHLLGLAILTRLLRFCSRAFQQFKVMPLMSLLIATVGIIALHTVEIWTYAIVYLALGTFDRFEEALYFSIVTYSSIGYGDVLMTQHWRLFGAIEGAAGIIMLGWSTAYLVSLLSQLKLYGHDWLRPN